MFTIRISIYMKDYVKEVGCIIDIVTNDHNGDIYINDLSAYLTLNLVLPIDTKQFGLRWTIDHYAAVGTIWKYACECAINIEDINDFIIEDNKIKIKKIINVTPSVNNIIIGNYDNYIGRKYDLKTFRFSTIIFAPFIKLGDDNIIWDTNPENNYTHYIDRIHHKSAIFQLTRKDKAKFFY